MPVHIWVLSLSKGRSVPGPAFLPDKSLPMAAGPCSEMKLIWPRSMEMAATHLSLDAISQLPYSLCSSILSNSDCHPQKLTRKQHSPAWADSSSATCIPDILSCNKHGACLPRHLCAPPARHVTVPHTLTSSVQQQQQLLCESLDVRVLAYCSHDHTVFWN